MLRRAAALSRSLLPITRASVHAPLLFARHVRVASLLIGRMRCTSAAAEAAERVDALGSGGSSSSSAADDDASEAPASSPMIPFRKENRPERDSSRKWVAVDSLGRAYSTGRRKTSVARVWVWPVEDPAEAEVRINKMSVSRFFSSGQWPQRMTVLAPFLETQTTGKYSVMATVKGGGVNGAPSHATARAEP